MSIDAGENRREAFRVDDLVGLEVRVIDPDEVEQLHASFESHRLRHGLRTHIGHHRDNQRALLKKIGVKQPDVAAYLFHVEDQLSRLVDQISLGGAEFEATVDATSPVNLSAVGIAFGTDLVVSDGAFLELVIRLMPGSHMIYVIAEVVRVKQEQLGQARVSARFARLHAEDDELLTRHIVRVQQLELQSRRRAG